MKSYHDNRGNLVLGTSILEDILQFPRKTNNLVKALDAFGFVINTKADAGDKKRDWIFSKSSYQSDRTSND